MTVFLDDRPYRLVAGTELSHLLPQLEPETQLALTNGLATVVDRFGNEVGSGGALYDGQRLYVAWQA